MNKRNHELATVFTSMATLLSSRGANPHRVKAYRRAADSLVTLEEDIAQIAQRGELQTISGIGKELSSKIQEFLMEGTFQAYEELKKPLPEDVRIWMKLPGFSEPVVHDLYFRFGITTLDDLEALVRSHLLRTLPSISHQSTEDIIEAIQELKKASTEPI